MKKGQLQYKTINGVIHEWYFGKKVKPIDAEIFDADDKLLMKAVSKMVNDGYWFAIYPSQISKKVRGKWTTKSGYKCAFTEKGVGRMGYGNALTDETFQQPTIHKAIWYSLFRLIKFKREY